jgi:hypothetical protein
MAPARKFSSPGVTAAKRRPLNLRTTDERRRKFELRAEISGRSLVQQVEHELDLADWLLTKMGEEGEPDLKDIFELRDYFRAVKSATIEAGRDAGAWKQYMKFFPYGISLDNNGPEIIAAFASVEAEINRELSEAKDFVKKHGAAPVEARRSDKAGVQRDLMHRYYESLVEEIEENRKRIREERANRRNDPAEVT